jgi:anti-sigma-K factor RskA
VAGTLRGRARRRFEALLPAHVELQRAVRRWQDRLLPLTVVVAPEAPPARVWRRIEQRLWPQQQSERVPSWWQRLAVWRALSGVTTMAALALALLATVPGEQAPPIVVVLQATGDAPQGGGTFVASFNADGRALVARPLAPVSIQPDRVLELWAVPPQGAPRSLGLVSSSGVSVIARDRLPKGVLDARATSALAVSVEPVGGSPGRCAHRPGGVRGQADAVTTP